MPMTPTKDELIALLYRALESENGLAVKSTSSDRLRQALYRVKRTEEMFAPLTLTLIDDCELLIVKKKDNNDGSE